MSLLNFLRRTTSITSQLSRVVLSSVSSQNNNVARSISSTRVLCNVNEDVNKKLMEFFDDSKNWNENEVKHGRSWSLQELRIKSNGDLHKLWFVLLKELNMLKTMEHEYKREWKWWASPERIDKVKDSMSNVESVVRERNRAYHLLETGDTGERPSQIITNALGLRENRKSSEHTIPYFRNKKWREENARGSNGPEFQKFIRLYREKLYNDKRKARNRDKNHVIRLLRRFPNLDRSMLQEKYPSINFDALKSKDVYRGHYVPRVE